MKVHQIISESQVDEGPVRFLQRTLGKNTATGKAAQLDVELDKETKKIFNDFYAIAKQDPTKKGMTAKSLANYLKVKGFISDPSAVMKYINQEPSLKRGLVKKGRAVKKAGAAGWDKAKQAGTWAKDKWNKSLAPADSGLGPKDTDPPYPAESQLMEVDVPLDSGQVLKVIKRFVQQGFQKNIANKISRHELGDAPVNPNAPEVKPDAPVNPNAPEVKPEVKPVVPQQQTGTKANRPKLNRTVRKAVAVIKNSNYGLKVTNADGTEI